MFCQIKGFNLILIYWMGKTEIIKWYSSVLKKIVMLLGMLVKFLTKTSLEPLSNIPSIELLCENLLKPLSKSFNLFCLFVLKA